MHIESISIDNTPLGDPLFRALLDCIASIPSLHSLTILPATQEKWVLKDPRFIQRRVGLGTRGCAEGNKLRGSGGLCLFEALGSEERAMLQELDVSGEVR